jgi:signal transduction histidine kinase
MTGLHDREDRRGEEALLAVLLEAIDDLGSGGDLDDVLRRVLELSCAATGARYGALGIIDEVQPDRLARFVTHGIDDEARAAIPHLPHGLGLLGRLIRDPRPVRLDDLTRAPDAVGFPVNHPPMRTFLGMPVRLGDRVFGNLYLTEKAGGVPFSEADERLVHALAGLAGTAVESVQHRASAALQAEVVDDIWAVHRSLLSEVDVEITLPMITGRTREIASAAAVAVVTLSEDGTRDVIASSGEAATVLARLEEPLAQALSTGQAVELVDTATTVSTHQDQGRTRTSVLPASPRSQQPTVLVVAGWRPRPGLSEARVSELLGAITVQVSLVLDQASREEDRHLLALLEDRDRIARDLHDLVIQRLFAIGLQLQGASRLVVRPQVLERLQSAVTELDATIRDIRATIFELQHRPGQSSLRADLRQLTTSYASTLGFAPVVQFAGPVDSAVDDDLQVHLLAVLRETLSNVARHAKASSVQVEVLVDDEAVVVRVADDGVGIPAQVTESGLRNMRTRAQSQGGTVSMRNREPHGTEVEWRVPL